MCAVSGVVDALGGKDVHVYMGYYGGSIKVGDVIYSEDASEKGYSVSADEMRALLESHSSADLARLIVALIRNCKEG